MLLFKVLSLTYLVMAQETDSPELKKSVKNLKSAAGAWNTENQLRQRQAVFSV